MEAADLNAPGYWSDPEPDLRVNPAWLAASQGQAADQTGSSGGPDRVGRETGQGLAAYLRAEPRLRGHVVTASSGSGGAVKWIALSKRALLASARAVNARLEAGPGDRWLRALPDYHVGGLGIHARAWAAGGEAIVFPGRWRGRAAEFAACCGREGITLASLTPTQVHDLVAESIRGPGCLRAAVVGGGRLDPETGAAARALGWPVLASYGMTEAGSQIATERLEALARPWARDWLPALACWELALNAEGLLRLRGEALYSGTIREEEGGWRFFPAETDAAGWHDTADRVELRRGSGGGMELKFLGRSDDLVKKLGELVSVAAVRERFEAELRRAGMAGTVLALPDPRLGHRLVAVFEDPGGNLSPGAMRRCLEACDAGAGPCGKIDAVERVAALPRAALGKIDRAALREALGG